MSHDTEQRTVWQLARLADCSDPDSLTSAGADFLRTVETSAVEAFNYANDDDRADDCWIGTSHDVADSCVPIYTHTIWTTFADLAAWQEDPTELGADASDMEHAAKVCLYMIGERLAAAILSDLADTSEEG